MPARSDAGHLAGRGGPHSPADSSRSLLPGVFVDAWVSYGPLVGQAARVLAQVEAAVTRPPGRGDLIVRPPTRNPSPLHPRHRLRLHLSTRVRLKATRRPGRSRIRARHAPLGAIVAPLTAMSGSAPPSRKCAMCRTLRAPPSPLLSGSDAPVARPAVARRRSSLVSTLSTSSRWDASRRGMFGPLEGPVVSSGVARVGRLSVLPSAGCMLSCSP